MLELRDKVEDEQLTAGTGTAPLAAAPDQPASEAIQALMALGYGAGEAAQAVARVADKAQAVDELVRLALKGMVK